MLHTFCQVLLSAFQSFFPLLVIVVLSGFMDQLPFIAFCYQGLPGLGPIVQMFLLEKARTRVLRRHQIVHRRLQ